MSNALCSALSTLSPETRELLRAELERRLDEGEYRRKLYSYYPDEGPLRRELYQRHLAFFAAGLEHKERLLLAANRVGKSEGAGGYETTLHLLGEYPAWWVGRRFAKPIVAWAAGETQKDVRDSIQRIMCGPATAIGTGMIPGDRIERVTPSGLPDGVDTVLVKHASGRLSQLTFKSYVGGREDFQAATIDVGWCDEEPPLAIYTEMLLRTMTTDGIVMCTFTPLKGLSEVVLSFLPDGRVPG